ncbi:hypothetical protein BV25DRAFT_1803098, partial [Artomyces pyxidatus]
QRRSAWLNEVELSLRREEANQMEIAKMLILDVKTRWSSTHQMLHMFGSNTLNCPVDYEHEIDNFVAKTRDMCEYEMTSGDWEAVKLVMQWLYMFRQATTQMSSTSCPTLSSVHAVFRGLQDEVKQALSSIPSSAPPQLLQGLIAAHQKLSDYYTTFDVSPYYLWSIFLDPRLGYAGLKVNATDEPEYLQQIEDWKNALLSHYLLNYVPVVIVDPSLSAITAVPWLSMTLGFQCTDRDCLSVGCAVAVKRIFSGGRDTISLRQVSLKPGSIRKLMLLKHHSILVRSQHTQKSDNPFL